MRQVSQAPYHPSTDRLALVRYYQDCPPEGERRKDACHPGESQRVRPTVGSVSVVLLDQGPDREPFERILRDHPQRTDFNCESPAQIDHISLIEIHPVQRAGGGIAYLRNTRHRRR